MERSDLNILKKLKMARVFHFIKTLNDIFRAHRSRARTEGIIKSIKEFPPLRGKNVLDVGCGEGILLEKLLDVDYVTYGIGIDFNLNALKFRQEKIFEKKFINYGLIIGDAVNIPLKDKSFDFVLSSQFFEHVYDKANALNEQVRLLKKKGIIVIEQANLLSITALLNLIFIYPIKTKGKRGGLKWLINHHKLMKNSYYKHPAMDEDVKSILWWKNFIDNLPATLIDIYSPLSKKLNINNLYLKIIISFFSSGLIIILTKDSI